jgi:hypothetical protein
MSGDTQGGSQLVREFLDRVQAPHGDMHAVIVIGGRDGHGPFAVLACCDSEEETMRLLRDAVTALDHGKVIER